MLKLVALDSGPLGIITHPNPAAETHNCLSWMRSLTKAKIRVVLPSVADYELRREYLRRNKRRALRELDDVRKSVTLIPISDDALIRAAESWAQLRQVGRPLADPKALDADCIIAAQVRLYAASIGLDDDEWIIATTDVGDMTTLARAAKWTDITPT